MLVVTPWCNGYCTVAMTSYGGIGREFRKDWVEPYFKKARAREIAEGGTGFKAVEAKQRFPTTCRSASRGATPAWCWPRRWPSERARLGERMRREIAWTDAAHCWDLDTAPV